MNMKEKPVYTAQDLKHALSERYSQPEWAYFSEVRNSTGYRSTITTADGIAMHMYPSRGFEIHGFEIKVSRSDWLSELKKPAKADEIFKYCHKWWLVVSDKDIVKDGELPHTWGLMVMQKNGLIAKVQAPVIEPEAFDMGFVASLLRSATANTVQRSSIQKKLSEEFDRGKSCMEGDVTRAEKSKEEAWGIIKAFEKAAGVKITRWHGEENAEMIGLFVRRALAEKKFNPKYNVSTIEHNLERLLKDFRKLAGQIIDDDDV